MSASSKKKLRSEQNAAKLTERQLAEQKEAKKLKVLTMSFTAVLAVILVVAIAFASVQFVNNSGIKEKNTVAATIGDIELSNAQLNYYYVDAAFEYANTYGAYASMFGLDFTKPLNEQVIDAEAGTTWADEFLNYAISNAKSTYAICAEAEANGYTLSEDAIAEIEDTIATFELYAGIYGYENADKYVQAYYGKGASVEGFREYSMKVQLCQEYTSYYANSLSYDEADLRAAEEGKEVEFNNYSYAYYYLNANKFLTGGTTDEEGNTTYTDEERAAALEAAEAAAKSLTELEITSVEDLNAAIAELSINAEAETTPVATLCENYAYSSVTSGAKAWITDAARTPGELGYVENVTTTTNDDGTETETVNGYYVVYFIEELDNIFPLINVRHILISPDGGTTDENGNTTFTEEEMASAKTEAEKVLLQWQTGDDTSEESFAALATELTEDTGSKENGGLYENVYPGQMVTNFNDWCFAEGRKAGDTGIVESDYGYHIMYFSGESDIIYRDFMIKNMLVNTETESWYTALVEAVEANAENTQYLSRDLVLSANS